MREIVLNSCFGGFSLSRKAFLRLRELGQENAKKEPDYGECWDDGSGPRESWYGGRLGHFCYNIPRDDPLLVQVVRELERESWGDHARLNIVKVPDDVEWEISEYDGSEHIAEKHRTWG